MTLRAIPIRRSGVRPILFMGGDRELVMLSGLLCAVLVFVTYDWLALITGVILWFFSLKGLRLMAKADPLMRAVYLRHHYYQSYYPARSTPFRDNRKEFK
ncbi:MAG: conjugal transfer protein TrbD [Legionella sp.]|uniref:conjugal transfer protein TrbD n=1 Tax=Legionella sp. TaxID=459 RepID=UPI0039E52FD6